MSRRNNGEGSVSQRPNGTWQASLQFNGTRRVLYAKTEKEARRKLADLLRQLAVSNALPSPGRRTVADLLDFWLDTVKDTLKPRTLADYQRSVVKGLPYVLPKVDKRSCLCYAPVVMNGELKRLRETKLLTQAELAAAAGVSEWTIWRMEQRKHRPRFSTIKKLAYALGVEPRRLVEKAKG